MTRTYKKLTVAEAYRRGFKSHCFDYQDALKVFIERYCPHRYEDSFCELCVAWQNGYDNQAMDWVHDHAKTCPKGLADRENHHDCTIDD